MYQEKTLIFKGGILTFKNKPKRGNWYFLGIFQDSFFVHRAYIVISNVILVERGNLILLMTFLIESILKYK